MINKRPGQVTGLIHYFDAALPAERKQPLITASVAGQLDVATAQGVA